MREILLAGVLAAASTFAYFALPAAASAASSAEDLAVCVAAINERGIAAADAFRPKFLKLRGGAVRRVSVLMIPKADGAKSIEAECSIKGGEVLEVAVKA